MEWLAQIQGQVVGLDTAPLIYFIEENPAYLEVTDAFFEAMFQGEFRVVTSVVTLAEVLVYPVRQGDTILAQQYREILFNSQGLTTIEVDSDIAEIAAQLRADYNLRTPDALQMATAIHEGPFLIIYYTRKIRKSILFATIAENNIVTTHPTNCSRSWELHFAPVTSSTPSIIILNALQILDATSDVLSFMLFVS